MKKILVLTTRYPYPVIGGDRLRIYQICKFLSREYKLTLLSLCETKAELNAPLPGDGVFQKIDRIYMPRWRSWLNCIASLPSRNPLQVAYYRNSQFYARALALNSDHDAILVHLIRASNAARELTGVKFLEMTDAISLNYGRIRKTKHALNDWRSQVYSMEALRVRRFEEEIVDHFDHSFLVSDIDRNFLFAQQEDRLKKVSVCSNGVNLSILPYQFDERGSDIVFIGNMCSLQNLDAVNFMVSDVLPLIRAHRQDVSLRLIGRIRHHDAVRFKQVEGVIVTGEVPDVAGEARNAGVGVCPLRLGAGIQNKVLEYMALGLPTVSTPLGLEGLSARDGMELLVANDAVGLADAVLRLLNNRRAAETMARAARGYVEANHSWDAQLAPVLRRINDSLAPCGRVGA